MNITQPLYNKYCTRCRAQADDKQGSQICMQAVFHRDKEDDDSNCIMVWKGKVDETFIIPPNCLYHLEIIIE